MNGTHYARTFFSLCSLKDKNTDKILDRNIIFVKFVSEFNRKNIKRYHFTFYKKI